MAGGFTDQENPLHVHPSTMHAIVAFCSVLVLGTVWRLTASHLVGKSGDGSKTNKLGRAMAVQY